MMMIVRFNSNENDEHDDDEKDQNGHDSQILKLGTLEFIYYDFDNSCDDNKDEEENVDDENKKEDKEEDGDEENYGDKADKIKLM